MKYVMLAVLIALLACVERSPGNRPLMVRRDASRPVRADVVARTPVLQDAGTPLTIPGFSESWRDEVIREYAALFAADSRVRWEAAVQRCIETDDQGGKRFIAPIREAARVLGGRYPAAFIAGLVIHESWCQEGALSSDGGSGYAQITPDRATGRVDARWLNRAKALLGHDPLWLTNPVDNIVVGLAELMIAEDELGSRELGLAAYNAGLGGVRSAMRELGWKTGDAPLPLNLVAPRLAYRAHHFDARYYAAKVLAATVYANRVVLGRDEVAVINRRRFRLQDIPGAVP